MGVEVVMLAKGWRATSTYARHPGSEVAPGQAAAMFGYICCGSSGIRFLM